MSFVLPKAYQAHQYLHPFRKFWRVGSNSAFKDKLTIASVRSSTLNRVLIIV